MSQFRSVIIGNESLAIQCGEMLLDVGHAIAAVVTRNDEVRTWATDKGLTTHAPGRDLADRLAGLKFDWLLSIANLDIIPADVLALPARGAVNFHDGPLPVYAGLNAPVWALINEEAEHGISWHMIEGGVDEGDILAQARFPITDSDTALTLNTKCYGAAMESFATVIDELAKPDPARNPQDLSQSSYFARDDRPAGGARIDFSRPATELVALVRALDHGDYRNPLACPKFEAGGRLWLAGSAHVATDTSGAAPGAVSAVDATDLKIATSAGDIILTNVRDCFGIPVDAHTVTKVGAILPCPTVADTAAVTTTLAPYARHDPIWRARIEQIAPLDLPLVGTNTGSVQPIARDIALPAGTGPADTQAALAVLAARLAGAEAVDLALDLPGPAGLKPGYICDWVPVRAQMGQSFGTLRDALSASIAKTRETGGFACDLLARLPGAEPHALPVLGLSDSPETGLVGNTALTLAATEGKATLLADKARVSDEALALIAARLEHLLTQVGDDADPAAIAILPEAERDEILTTWNATAVDYPVDTCVHSFFEQQAARTPDAEALAFEGDSLSYGALNARANQLAHLLIGMGVKPGTIVGLHLPRSAELLIAALGILKAGGAYLPMDPAYPAERTALYIEDSGTPIIVTTAALAATLPDSGAQVLTLDTAPGLGDAATDNPASGVTGADLAYLIYTSGSTGRPKGVMVEHRNVANFFTGMDDRIAHEDGGVWMAVTSLSFDISVLELFWTLARGFKIVLSGDENRALVAGDSPAPRATGGMEFSLYYWGNDDGVGRDKYRTLLEGAKFGDQHGFCAVWTPERHFHAFGGPYPNPSVTGAAVAAVTQNIGVRAGSCVAPLHHTARIAEEWAVVDNLTNGRAGLAIASGWQPDDFVLRPENSPPDNKPAMFQAIADLRRLWAGEKVAFPRKDGTPFEVLTQPRPVSKKLNVWVTTAGNPETWIEAGRNGCNVLTHLLGQSVAEVGEKIKLYHEALREAGYSPADFTVTLMLHSFLAETRDEAREIAREPMKGYLRSAAGLIKQYAWAFPAFKKPKGVDNAFQLDLGSLSEDELEGILDFAFERYFNDSGLFGTVEDALTRVEEVKAIGVNEIACLIDYGIDVDTILDGLNPLAEVVRLAGGGIAPISDDYSIAAQIARHKVTHLQCTPSMAQMLVMNDEAAAALKGVRHLMIGGEALPGALVGELAKLTDAHIENMYGPTETTIWSTTQTATPGDGVVGIGRPIANTQVYVLDEAMQPLPIGVAGELYIGGASVTRGYWQQPEQTAERFLADPFSGEKDARLYRTGDLARWRPDGTLDFLGRADFQVKLRGFRIELGEIESVIDTLDGIRQSVAMAREDMPGVQQLVAYLLTEAPVDEAALKAELATHLPAHMIPGRFIGLTTMPLTPNKKVDREALPSPVALRQTKPATTASPAPAVPENGSFAGDVTQEIATIWSSILGVTGIGPRDSFFDLGGHSLLAVQAHREIRSRMGVQTLSITDIFRFPTLGALAATVGDKLGGGAKSPAKDTEKVPDTGEKAAERADAMARRRAMRARRQPSV